MIWRLGPLLEKINMGTNTTKIRNIFMGGTDGSYTTPSTGSTTMPAWSLLSGLGGCTIRQTRHPIEKPPVSYSWIPDHTPNTSGSSAGTNTLRGSSNAYMPYTTTKPKIQSWVPPQK